WWWPRWRWPPCRWRWSLRPRCATAPAPQATWPRPPPWRPRWWRTSPRRCTLPHAHCPTPSSRPWRPSPARRQHLVGRLTAEKQRWRQALPAVQAKVAAHMAWLEQAVRELDGERDQTLRASPLWRARDHLLRETAGGGADRLVDRA